MTAKTIQTTRFGEIPVTGEHLIRFRDGMIGFPHLKEYVLIESSSMPVLLWLQSTENPAVAFPVIEPWFFRQDYKPSASESEKIALELDGQDRTKLFVVLTIPPEMTNMTVNLKAPVIINLDKGTAVQIILSDKAFEVRVPAYDAFSQAIANYSLHQSAESDLGEKPEANTEEDSWAPVAVKGGRSPVASLDV